jgi:hypothetical protein
MNELYEKLLSNKYNLILRTINNIENNKKLFTELDLCLVEKCFKNVHENYFTDNLVKLEDFDFTSQEIKDFVNTFWEINTEEQKFQYLKKILSITNLSDIKVQNALNKDYLIVLGNILSDVSCETKKISYDFIILQIFDNLLPKVKSKEIVNFYQTIKSNILQKLISFNYDKEKYTTDETVLFWLEKMSQYILNSDIFPLDYISLSRKILDIVSASPYLFWKNLGFVSTLLLQPKLSTNADLRKQKTYYKKLIENSYEDLCIDEEYLLNLTIKTLSLKHYSKEDFYFLFDNFYFFSKKGEKEKLYVLDLCKYVIYKNSNFDFFSRFIRKYFVDFFFKILSKRDTSSTSQKEISILLDLFYIKGFYEFHKNEIFENIIKTLNLIYVTEDKLDYDNFYKYCDIIDFIITTNGDLKINNLTDFLLENDSDKKIVSNYFTLSNLEVA